MVSTQILDRPHPLYNVIKKHWDSNYFGTDKSGKHPVYYDRPAGVNMKRMRELGITDADLCYHFVWISEYCYKYIANDVDNMSSCITVYNLKGMDRSLFYGAKKALLQKTMKIMEQHYPERTWKILILNGPVWFDWLAWPMAKKMASQQTLDKVKNFGNNFIKFSDYLKNYVKGTEIPEIFGGDNPTSLNQGRVSVVKVVLFCVCVCVSKNVH